MHDFKNFPELTNKQMDFYYFESPHKQITEDFRARVVKVIDGDTIRVLWDERPFTFPVRFLYTNAPEMSEQGGEASQKWLASRIKNKMVDIIVTANQRVDKWGRLLGVIMSGGVSMNEESIRAGHATNFDQREEGKLPNINKMVAQKWR